MPTTVETYRRLHRLFFEPDHVAYTAVNRRRWLTDRFVIVAADAVDLHGWPHQRYGWLRLRRTQPPQPVKDLGKLLTQRIKDAVIPLLERDDWYEVKDTGWAVARPNGQPPALALDPVDRSQPRMYVNANVFAGWREIGPNRYFAHHPRGPIRVDRESDGLLVGFVMPLRIFDAEVPEPPTQEGSTPVSDTPTPNDADARTVGKNGKAAPSTITRYSEHGPAIKTKKRKKATPKPSNGPVETTIAVNPEVMEVAKAQLTPGTRLEIVDEETVMIVNDTRKAPTVARYHA